MTGTTLTPSTTVASVTENITQDLSTIEPSSSNQVTTSSMIGYYDHLVEYEASLGENGSLLIKQYTNRVDNSALLAYFHSYS